LQSPVPAKSRNRASPTGLLNTTGEPAIRIVIAGEHAIFRDGLRRLLEAEPGFAIVGEEGDGSRADAAVRDADPDILVLGLASSDRTVTETLRAVVESATRVRIILLSDRLDTPEVADALAEDISGVVLKESAPDVLFKSIRAVMAGQIWLGHGEARRRAQDLRKVTAARRHSRAFGLTARQMEITRSVVAGCSNREIADRACISENTVKSHLTQIFNKSGASSRVELALFARHHRLLDGV
jgi:two-component system, NarL family, nitrate/nitrite response regulator NarL